MMSSASSPTGRPPPLLSVVQKLCIKDAETDELVPFRPWKEQREILQVLERGESPIILKARQVGSSTACALYTLYTALFAPGRPTVAIVSHKQASVSDLLDRVKTAFFSLPPKIRKFWRIQKNNESQLSFANAGRILTVTAAGQGGLRSFSCSLLWISELAFAPNPDELLSSVDASIGSGQIIIESTANHPGDALHRLWTDAAPSGLTPLFFPWYAHERYRTPITSPFTPTPEEQDLAAKYNLTPEQLLWRRTRISRLGSPLRFVREYPATPEEAWTSSSRLLFPSSSLTHIKPLPLSLGPGKTAEARYEDPIPHAKYVMGIDPAGGTGNHRSSIRVLTANNRSVVYAFDSAEITPQDLAAIVHREAVRYNNALVLLEEDTYGAVILDRLDTIYGYRNIVPPSRPTRASKEAHIRNLASDLPLFTAIDRVAISDLLTITDEDGCIEVPETPNGHADAAMALSLANTAARRLPIPATSQPLPAAEVVLKKKRLKALHDIFRGKV